MKTFIEEHRKAEQEAEEKKRAGKKQLSNGHTEYWSDGTAIIHPPFFEGDGRPTKTLYIPHWSPFVTPWPSQLNDLPNGEYQISGMFVTATLETEPDGRRKVTYRHDGYPDLVAFSDGEDT